jgi:hypothetical protein
VDLRTIECSRYLSRIVGIDKFLFVDNRYLAIIRNGQRGAELGRSKMRSKVPRLGGRGSVVLHHPVVTREVVWFTGSS